MPCYHPLKGFIVGYKLDNKTKVIKLTSNKINHLEKIKGESEYREIEVPQLVNSNCRRRIDEYVDIPCGKCLGCRMDYAKTWSCRLLCELETQPKDSQSWFLTLTYDDLSVPLIYQGIEPHMSLNKSHVSAFMKNLRAKVHRERKSQGLDDIKIRYYAAGEYGSKTFRPHIHMILFNCPIPDLTFKSLDKSNNVHYYSKWLERIWSFGAIDIGRVTPESCAYTARYCCKKAFGNTKEEYQTLGIEPEFILMSRNPGIGYKWLEERGISALDFNEIVLETEKGNKTYSFPRYYMTKLSEQNGDFVELVKENRKRYIDNKRLIENMQSSVSYLDRLEQQERLLINKFNKERDFNG